MEKAYLNWSGGKDATLALYHTIKKGILSVDALFTVLKSDSRKVAMHEVGIELLEQQSYALGIPLVPFYFNPEQSDTAYGMAMEQYMHCFKAKHITIALFGDLYLEELRKSREMKCNKAGMTAMFPLWGMSSRDALTEFIQAGFKAIVTCVDNAVLPEKLVGSMIDETFFENLPEGVDACGENGEYHTFVFDGPIFRKPVDFKIEGQYSRTFSDVKTGISHQYTYLKLNIK